MRYDNPAERLLVLLEKGMTLPTNNSCITNWCALLDVKPKNNYSLYLSRLGAFMNLPREIEKMIEVTHPEHLPDLNYPFARLNNAFGNQSHQSSWDNFTKHIDRNTLTILKMTSTLLKQVSPEVLKDDRLGEIRTHLNDIFDELVESELCKELKEFVGMLIKDALNAIDDYRLTGKLPITKSVSNLLFQTTTEEHREEILKSEFGRKMIVRLIKILSILGSSITILESGYMDKLLNEGEKLLQGLKLIG